MKRNFDPVDSETEFDDGQFNVPFPGVKDNLAAGIMGSFITLTNADVSEIFRPIVDKVIELVERQRNVLAAHGKTAKGLIMVGGFGFSGYLYRYLKSRFADEDPPPAYTSSSSESATAVEEGPRYIIMQPESSWTGQRRGIGRARKRPCGQQKGETSLRSGLQRIMGSLDPFTQEQVHRPYHERAQSEKPDVMVHRAGARHAK